MLGSYKSNDGIDFAFNWTSLFIVLWALTDDTNVYEENYSLAEHILEREYLNAILVRDEIFFKETANRGLIIKK